MAMHIFEAANLGKAPYQFMGCNEKAFVVPGEAPRPGSSCDYCGTGILYEFWFRSADGRKFKVGCDCYGKAEDTQRNRVLVTKAQDRMMKALKAQRLSDRIRAARDRFEADPTMFTDRLHPSPMRTGTLRDYVEWMFRCAGAAGRLKVTKMIEKETKR